MARNAIDLALVAAILIGGVFAFRAGRERAALAAHHARLVAAAGELAIEDPALIYLKALETDDPLHFAWRVHLPGKINLKVKTRMGGSSSNSGWHSDPQDFIARVRLREEAPNQVRVYTKFAGGGGSTGYDSPELARFLRERANELKAEQAGRTETAAINPNAAKPTVLVHIGLPAGAPRPPDLPGWIDPANLVEVSIGAPGAFP